MTIITTGPKGGGDDVTGSQLMGVSSEPVSKHIATEYDLTGDNNVKFVGTGFTYSGTTPTSGTVNQFIVSNGSTLDVEFTGLNVAFATLWGYMTSGNQSGFDTLLFGGNDTFTAGDDSAHRTQDNDNHFFGFGGNDVFNMQSGSGFDTVSGGGGNDTINVGALFRTTDKIDGGSGTDTLNLSGNYSDGVTFGATTVTTVEKIGLADGFNYKLTTNDATVASGKSMTVDGSHLTGAHTLNFNGAAETNGKFVIVGGTGNDTLVGGHGNDTITGGAGADKLTGGLGSDIFVYKTNSDSPGTAHNGSAGHGYDTVTDFNASADKIETWHALSGMNTAITSGALSTTTFDTNMGNILKTSAQLGAYHAVLVTPSSGTLAHQVFLVVDMNGVAGYQSGADLVIHLTGATNLTHIATSGDFVT